MGKTGAVVIAVIVGGAIGYYIGTRPKGGTGDGVSITPAQKCLTPNNQIIDVSLQGTPSCPEARVSKSNKDEIVWQSPQDTSLWISFSSGGLGSSNGGNTNRFTIPGTYTPNNTPIYYGINVFGNKGSTDQHAYVQQLRDGINNFFVTFVRVLESGGHAIDVEPGVTPGDYLHGLLIGTREALAVDQACANCSNSPLHG